MKYLAIILFLVFSFLFSLNAQRHFHVALATEEEEVDSLEYYITEGNPLAWFVLTDSVVYDGADSTVSRWGDYLNGGLSYIQATGENQPKWLGDTLGIEFDGAGDVMECSFGGAQDSVMVYIVFSINAGGWGYGDDILELDGTGSVLLSMYATFPNIALYKNTFVGEISVGGTQTIGIARIYHAYESSTRFWRFNDSSSNSYAGFQIVTSMFIGGSSDGGNGDCTVYEIILMEDRVNEDKIYEKLSTKWL